MALTREEVETMARCKANCVMAGILFGGSVTGDMRYTPTVTPVNVTGLVKEEELIVPHSEWAIVSGSAGKKLIAWGLRVDGRYAHVVYENEKDCCGYTHGLPSEVMSPGLLRVTKDLLHIKEG